MNYSNDRSFSALIFIRYGISVNDSLKMLDNWLKTHPEKSQETLIGLLKSGKVIVKNKNLFDIPQLSLEKATLLATQIYQDKRLEVKDRWYQLKCYRQCFIGSELVDYLVRSQEIEKEEAIAIGQSLLEHDLIHHVCHDHEFKNDFLFYRFKN